MANRWVICHYHFKGKDCGYSGPDRHCTKMPLDCQKKGNLHRFPALPQSDLVTPRKVLEPVQAKEFSCERCNKKIQVYTVINSRDRSYRSCNACAEILESQIARFMKREIDHLNGKASRPTQLDLLL